MIGDAIDVGAPLYNARKPDACYHVYDGAASDILREFGLGYARASRDRRRPPPEALRPRLGCGARKRGSAPGRVRRAQAGDPCVRARDAAVNASKYDHLHRWTRPLQLRQARRQVVLRSRPHAARLVAIAFGIVHLVTAALIVFGVFFGLPARWAPVDVTAAVLIALEAAAGGALLARSAWAERVASAAAIVALVIGLAVVTTLALTASWLSGVYGPVGRGGGIILVLVAAMVLPYLVVLPAVQLFWMHPAATPRR